MNVLVSHYYDSSLNIAGTQPTIPQLSVASDLYSGSFITRVKRCIHGLQCVFVMFLMAAPAEI